VAAINELMRHWALTLLETTEKANLVAAINEVHTLAHGSSPVSGVSGEIWTINDDLTNATVSLVFGRTTGGSAIFAWDGTTLSLNKTLDSAAPVWAVGTAAPAFIGYRNTTDMDAMEEVGILQLSSSSGTPLVGFGRN
jgi:hypothetical protein